MPQSTQGSPGAFGYNDQGQLINSAQPTNYILAFILGALQSMAAALGGSPVATNNTNLPYNADEQVLTNVVGGPGPTVIVYKKAGSTVKTRTLTYTGSGPTDVLIHTVDS